MWLVSSYMEHEATIQEGLTTSHLCLSLTMRISDVDGTFFVTFNGLFHCTMDCIDYVLHARTDRDTVTDSDLAATPSSNDWSVLGATTPVKEQGHVEHAGSTGV